MADVRPSAVAGTWYPATRAELAQAVDDHLAAAAPEGERSTGQTAPCAIVAPHAGLVYSGPVAAYAYRLVSNGGYAAAVLVGPSHFVGFSGAAIWPRGSWETPFGRVPVDEALAAAIVAQDAGVREHPPAHQREHSLEMQMPFVARLLPGVPIVPIVMGYQARETCEALGRALAAAIAARPVRRSPQREGGRQSSGDRVLLIASSDLSHYEDARRAAEMDAVVVQHVDALDPEGLMGALEREPRHACGGGPMVAVLHAARLLGASRARVLRYADSGDVSGDKTSVVGYMAAAVW